jgi:hypothetical protein
MAINITPLINGKSYEWADITVNILGVPVVGVTAIEYAETQAMENVYGAGERPVSRGYGKIEPTAKITLLMEEVESLQTAAPDGRLNKIPEFDIVVAYLDTNLVPRKHVLRNARFMNNVRTSSQGETSIPVEIDLLISHVEWN